MADSVTAHTSGCVVTPQSAT